MDIKIISFLTILALNVSLTFANTKAAFTEIRPVEPININLAPVSPVVADFDDVVLEADAPITILLPVTPDEATFDDEIYTESITEEVLLKSLAPSTPKEAGFEEPI